MSAGLVLTGAVAFGSALRAIRSSGVVSVRLRLLVVDTDFTRSSTSATASSRRVTFSLPTTERRVSATSGPNQGRVRTPSQVPIIEIEPAASKLNAQRERVGGIERAQPPVDAALEASRRRWRGNGKEELRADMKAMSSSSKPFSNLRARSKSVGFSLRWKPNGVRYRGKLPNFGYGLLAAPRA
jgi:hypothetical protein